MPKRIKHEEIWFIPLFDIKNKKLNFKKFKEYFVDEYNKGKKKFYEFGFWCLSRRDLPDNQRYEMSGVYEIWREVWKGNKRSIEFDYGYIYGQSGLYLMIDVNRPYKDVDCIIKSDITEKMIKIAKKCLFIPYAVEHFSDGDYYCEKQDFGRFSKSYEIL